MELPTNNHVSFRRTKAALLVLAVQTYMYSLLQSLHLVHPLCMPGSSFLVPFGELAPTQLVPLPADLSFGSLTSFFLGLLKTPSLLVYSYVYLRPMLEIRLYRLIRRRLPKPSLADELSIRVAFENDLIDWMVPTLGRRSEEENRRSNLTLYEDIKYELSVFRNWAFSWFNFSGGKASSRAVNTAPREERIESLRQCIEELQNELGTTQPRENQTRPQLDEHPQVPEQTSTGRIEDIQTSPAGPNPQTPARETIFDGDRILENEENRVSQSPDAMSTDYYSEMAPLGRTRRVASSDPQSNQPSTSEGPRDSVEPENRRASRSNTMFSRPSSPETSPPTSPRVRASLIHQNSDIITMQLELLGNRNPQSQNQANNLGPRLGNEGVHVNFNDLPTDRRSITEFLDSLISNPDQNLSTIVNSDAVESDGLSNLTGGVSPAVADGPSAAASHNGQVVPAVEDPAMDSIVDTSVPALPNIMPDGVEEPDHEETHNGPIDTDLHFETRSNRELPPPASNTHVPQQLTENTPSMAHRVTILSSHPVDSLASHLASMITTIAFLPLESLYLRSLASSYLASRSFSPTLHSDVRALGVWGGGGSATDILAYIGKLSLMMGVQAAVNASVWGVISGAAIRMGKGFCGWGNL